MQISIKDKLCMPERAYPTSAGLDLKAEQDHVLYPNESFTMGTGIHVAVPEGYVGLVFSRSGMGKIKVTLSNSVGVIDAEYRGPLKLMLINHGETPLHINKYDRIGQLVLVPIITPELEVVDTLDDTERGHGGFGSTGKQ